MALGTFGSTLNDELNRLANGGTYRDMNQMVDEALAAKQWANRENINPYSTDTVGILNEIAGLGLDKKNWLDFNGVCNYIAGTTGLPAAAALRQVYPTTDLLTGVASYYVDGYAGSNYIPTTASGYMYLPGVAGNYASAPDSSALDITGDIDLRVKVALDNWIYPASQMLIAKLNTTVTAQRSYRLSVVDTGRLRLLTSSTGSNEQSIDSTVSIDFLPGTTKWIRATLDVDNGASGNDVRFFTSDDGTNWTQLGSTVTTAGTTSIFNSTANLEIGTRDAGTQNPARGRFFRAQVYAGLAGTDLRFDANFETAMTSQTVASFTESSSNAATVTINRTTYNFQLDTIANLGAAGSLLPTTLGSSTAADSNDPKFLDHTGTNYVYTPGVTGNNLTIPDSNALDITGDIDLRFFISLDDWTRTGDNWISGKWETGHRSWYLRVRDSGVLELNWSADGTNQLTETSPVAPTISDGASLWIRVTLDVNNGAGTPQYEVKFFTSNDGNSWTQLGGTRTGTTGPTSIYSGPSNVTFGSVFAAGSLNTAGKLFRAQIFASIDGTDKRLDVDTSVITAGSATSFTALTGQTVTINRSTSGRKTVAVTQPTWLFGTDDYMEVNNRYMSSGTYLYLPGVASNYASAPDSAALDITGDIDIRVKAAMDDWTPSAAQTLIGKWATGGNLSYDMEIGVDGKVYFYWTTNGSTVITRTSSVVTGITDGATKWVRATLDVDNGASGHDVKFFLSDDGTNWTQLGTTVTTAGTTSIFSGAAVIAVGANSQGNGPSRGKFFRAQVLNGIGGTVAFDANFEGSITSLNQASFTESSSNAATVTINRSGSAYRSAGITAAGYLYPGATNTFAASATDFLNFGAADSFTVMAAFRQFGTNDSYIITKRAGSVASNNGYALYNVSGITYLGISDGVNQTFASRAYISGNLTTSNAVRNVTSDNLQVTNNTTSSTAATDSTTGTLAYYHPLRIGALATTTSGALEGELYAAAVFRSALTAAQIRQISNYFANREVYL